MQFDAEGTLIEAACGFAGTCGRWAGHRGHHGGWRAGGPRPDLHAITGTAQPGDQLTQRETEVLAEYAFHGSYKDTGACLGIAEQTARNHGFAVLVKVDVGSMIQALVIIEPATPLRHQRAPLGSVLYTVPRATVGPLTVDRLYVLGLLP